MTNLPRQILTFLVLVFLFSSIPYALMIHTGHIHGITVTFVMWCPTLAALSCCALFRIDAASLGWSWRPAKYEAIAYFLPWVYALPVYIACWIAVKGSFAFQPFARHMSESYAVHSLSLATAVGLPLLVIFGMASSMATALGEEIGWRGFFLPRLAQQFGFGKGCFISGLVWAMWHYPGLLWADYNAGTNKLYALACFTCMVIALAFIMGWLRLKSGSLWPCAVLHASHNLLIQAVLDQLTAPAGRALYITTEFGAGLALTAIITAAILWRSRPQPETYRDTATHVALAAPQST